MTNNKLADALAARDAAIQQAQIWKMEALNTIMREVETIWSVATPLVDLETMGQLMHAKARFNAAIAALRQPVPDAVRELADEWRGRIAVAYDEYSHGQRAGYQVAAADLDRALASQQESRNE